MPRNGTVYGAEASRKIDKSQTKAFSGRNYPIISHELDTHEMQPKDLFQYCVSSHFPISD